VQWRQSILDERLNLLVQARDGNGLFLHRKFACSRNPMMDRRRSALSCPKARIFGANE